MLFRSLAERVGKKRSTIANYIRLLKLPAQIQSALNNDMISMGHARALLGLPGERQQLAMLAKIVKGHLSVRQTELAVQQALAPSKGAAGTVKDNTEYPVCYSQLVERLEPLVGSRISIKRKAVTGKNGKTAFQGKIVIDFESDEQVKEILGRLEKLSVKH